MTPPPFYEADEEEKVPEAAAVADDLFSMLEDAWAKLTGHRRSKAERLFRSDAPSVKPRLAAPLPALAAVVLIASSDSPVLALRGAVDRALPTNHPRPADSTVHIPFLPDG